MHHTELLIIHRHQRMPPKDVDNDNFSNPTNNNSQDIRLDCLRVSRIEPECTLLRYAIGCRGYLLSFPDSWQPTPKTKILEALLAETPAKSALTICCYGFDAVNVKLTAWCQYQETILSVKYPTGSISPPQLCSASRSKRIGLGPTSTMYASKVSIVN